MEDYQLRLLDERNDLEDKLSKLAQFLENKINIYRNVMPISQYSSNDNLLNRQYEIMLQYHQILTQRICLFRKED